MSILGNAVIALIMVCALVGAIAAIFNDKKGLGKEFLEGLHAIGHIFIPVAGIMASIPFLSAFVKFAFGPMFASIGADPSIAATSFIAVDMGGYQLAQDLAVGAGPATPEAVSNWIMAMVVGYMAGATIVFSIPVGLALLDKRDHKYMALGVMSGLLSIPVGVFVACTIIALTDPMVVQTAAAGGEPSIKLALTFGMIFANLVPLLIFVVSLALGLRFFPDMMIRGFMIFGRVMDAAIKLVLVCSIIEYFTAPMITDDGGVFAWVFGAWGFDPIIADSEDNFRALEVAGYIGIMLAGAFPMVYMINKYLAKPVQKLGEFAGLEGPGAAGILASIANILAMFRLIRDMRPKDKVLNIAFAVCAAFLFGDHLSFTANFQPNLILPILVGKLSGGVFAFILAYWLSVPKALLMEKADLEAEKDKAQDQDSNASKEEKQQETNEPAGGQTDQQTTED